MEELKPCPFCGSKDIYISYNHNLVTYIIYEDEKECHVGATVKCGHCGARSGQKYNAQLAEISWNRREGENVQPENR